MDDPYRHYLYFIICPNCGSVVPLPDDEPDDIFCVAGCLDCDTSFDYDPDDVQVRDV